MDPSVATERDSFFAPRPRTPIPVPEPQYGIRGQASGTLRARHLREDRYPWQCRRQAEAPSPYAAASVGIALAQRTRVVPRWLTALNENRVEGRQPSVRKGGFEPPRP